MYNVTFIVLPSKTILLKILDLHDNHVQFEEFFKNENGIYVGNIYTYNSEINKNQKSKIDVLKHLNDKHINIMNYLIEMEYIQIINTIHYHKDNYNIHLIKLTTKSLLLAI